MWEGIDRRKFPRVKHKCLLRVTEPGAESVFETFTENVGTGGICVVLDKEITLFKNAKIDLWLSEYGPPISCKGTVVWSIKRGLDKKPDRYKYDIGIEFTEISKEDGKKISDMVENLLGQLLDNDITP